MRAAMGVSTQSMEADGLSWGDVIESLPTDPGSLFGVMMILAFFAAVVWFGTRGGGGKPPSRSEAAELPRDRRRRR